MSLTTLQKSNCPNIDAWNQLHVTHTLFLTITPTLGASTMVSTTRVIRQGLPACSMHTQP